MRYLVVLVVSGLAAWMTSPYYLSIVPSANSVVAKIVAFVIFSAVLSLIVRKKKKA